MFKLKRLCELCCIVIGTALFVDILCSISFSFRFFFFFFLGGGGAWDTTPGFGAIHYLLLSIWVDSTDQI
jgi:hypothetical protein